MGRCKAAVVLLSGGLDSSVLLHRVAREQKFDAIHALSFNYGQRHAKELRCARKQAAAAGAAHRIIDVSFMGELLRGGSSLIAGGAKVPELSELEAGDLQQPSTYVPNRNMMLLSMAAAFAEAQGIHDIFYGAQAQDEYGYWDCTADFLERINAVLALNRKEPVLIHAPLVTTPKSEIVRLGTELGVDFSQTWSCYRGEQLACGTCPTCVERLKAFETAGLADPIPYSSQ